MQGAIRTAAIVSTGDEIVGGRTVDTNSGWLADRLAALGIDVVAFVAVSDDVDRIAWAWRSVAGRADLVISTGGLGPTTDDLTSEAVAQVAGVPLVADPRQEARIRDFFASRGREMPANNLRQALLPSGAEAIDNPVGTAPGYRVRLPRGGGGEAVGMVFPGVPREMKPMFDGEALPWIAARVEAGRVVASRTFSTFGLPESALDQRLRALALPADVRLAYRASFPRITVRVSVAGEERHARAAVDRAAALVRDCIAEVVYADDDSSMEQVVGRLLVARGLTLATAESCSGGLIGSRLTDVPGSSAYYRGGVVAYHNDLKQRVLGVAASTLESHGAVSEETAREMASGVLALVGTDFAVATTGIAGPDGGSEAKPVGTVAIAAARRSGGAVGVDSRLYRFRGGRDWVKVLTSQVALDWVRRMLLDLAPLEPASLAASPVPGPT